MNTLPRTITVQVLADPNLFDRLQRHWSELMCSSRKHELLAMHHLLYSILLGKDWRKGFTCVTNQRKLANGAFFGWSMFRAIASLHMPSREAELLSPFDGIVTPIMLLHIRQFVPAQNAYTYRPEQFTSTSFPFEAYVVPPALAASAHDIGNTNA